MASKIFSKSFNVLIFSLITGCGVSVNGTGAPEAASAGIPDAAPAAPADAAPSMLFDVGPTPTADAALDAGLDAAPVCIPRLDNIGAQDFTIAFDVMWETPGNTVGLLNQRLGCDTSPQATPFWDIQLGPGGGIAWASSDGAGHLTTLESGDNMTIGQTHHVEFRRVNGLLMYLDDGTVRSSTAADTYGGAFSNPVNAESDECPPLTSGNGIVNVSNICITLGN